jgi:phage terminase large subunit-like protein
VKASPPRIALVPKFQSSLGQEAIELAASAGLVLDPWEALVLESALGRKANGKWAAFEVGLVVSRQNGKGAILEARELASLFLIGDRLAIHSAHQFDTSLEAFRRLLTLIEDTPDLDKAVKRVSRSHGEEGIELKNGSRIRFRTRTKGGGRGFSSDCLILDEAMYLPIFAHGALLPTLSARPNPQVWYTGSAVDQLVHEDGTVLSSVRQRGIAKNKSLCYFEWSVEADNPDVIPDGIVKSPAAWSEANPALGIRITKEHVALEQASMDDRTFAVERLGVGDWPPVTRGETVIDLDKWEKLRDPDSSPLDPVFFSWDVSPARSFSTIAVAGRRADDLAHVEIVERKRGTSWVVDRLVRLNEQHEAAAFVVDEKGPGASLVSELAEAGLKIEMTNAYEMAQGCGLLFDAVEDETLRHLDTAELRSAIKGAAKRPLGDAWAWSRKNSAVDISPLVAVTLAHWSLVNTVVPEEAGFAFV